MAKTLMAVDAGTGSVRAVLFSLDGEQLGCVQQEWTHLEDPRFPGSMDFDWTTNWELARNCIRGVIENLIFFFFFNSVLVSYYSRVAADPALLIM